MCIHIKCICIYIYIHMYICVYIHMYAYIYIHIMSYHIISYYIIWYDMIWYDIMLSYVILYYIIYGVRRPAVGHQREGLPDLVLRGRPRPGGRVTYVYIVLYIYIYVYTCIYIYIYIYIVCTPGWRRLRSISPRRTQCRALISVKIISVRSAPEDAMGCSHYSFSVRWMWCWFTDFVSSWNRRRAAGNWNHALQSIVVQGTHFFSAHLFGANMCSSFKCQGSETVPNKQAPCAHNSRGKNVDVCGSDPNRPSSSRDRRPPHPHPIRCNQRGAPVKELYKGLPLRRNFHV